MFDYSNKENKNISLITEDHPVYINVDCRTVLKYAKKDLTPTLYSFFETTVKDFLTKAAALYDSAKANKPRFQELVNKCKASPKNFLSEVVKNKDINDDVMLRYIEFLQFRKNIQEHGNKFIAAFDVVFVKCILYIKKSVEKKSVHFPEDSRLESIQRIPKVRKGIGFFPKPDESHKRKLSGMQEAGENSKKILKSDEASVEKPPKATNLN